MQVINVNNRFYIDQFERVVRDRVNEVASFYTYYPYSGMVAFDKPELVPEYIQRIVLGLEQGAQLFPSRAVS